MVEEAECDSKKRPQHSVHANSGLKMERTVQKHNVLLWYNHGSLCGRGHRKIVFFY